MTAVANVADLVGIYQSAYTVILERIAAKAAGGRSAAYDRAVLADLERILLELDRATAAWISDTLAASYRQGMTTAITTIAAVDSSAALTASMTLIHRRAVAALAANMAGDLADARQRVGRHAIDLVRQIGLEETGRKVATGDSVRGATKRLAQRIRDEGVTPPGMMRIDAYARLVARSTTREATNLGNINATTEAGYDLVQITSHSSPCPICAQYEGRVYSVSGNTRDYPALRETAFSGGYSNIHPNCRHVTTPYIPALADDPRADRAASNAPFRDTRSDREKRAYQREQTRRRQQAQTRNQWERYKAAFGDDVPGPATFASMKARNSEGYQELLRDYRRVMNG